MDDNEVMSLPITITTEEYDKSLVTSLSYINKNISHVESFIGNVVENVYIFNDRISSQFRSRSVFHFLAKIRLKNNIAWHFN